MRILYFFRTGTSIPVVWALLLSAGTLVRGDQTSLTPVLSSTTGLTGDRHTKVTWPAQPGVRYRVERSASLAPDGAGSWSTRALVEGGEWVDAEPPGTRAFFRVPEPQPEVFSISPMVMGPAGTTLTIEGQCLPAGSSLVFQIDGAPPVSVLLTPGEPGQYSAALPVGAVVPGANILSAAIVNSGGVVILDIKENFEVTATGRASEPPPRLPPAAVARLSGRLIAGEEECDDFDPGSEPFYGMLLPALMKAKEDPARAKCAARMMPGGDDCDDGDPDPGPLNSFLMPALMKAKEKANRTKCGNNLRQIGLKKEEGGRHTPFHNKYRPQFLAGSLPGEVSAEHDDISLDTPAGPPIAWTRTYRSKSGGGGGGSGGWSSCFDIRIEPVPLAAGANASRVYLYGGDGRRDLMVRQSDGTFTCTGMFRTGRFNPDTSFTLTFADNSQFIFCQLVGAPWSGRIGNIVDANGVALTCTYNASSQLATVTSQFGQSLTCAYGAGGELLTVTDHTQRFVAYEYYAAGMPGGSQGDLKSVSCPQMPGQPPVAGPVTYTYTTGHADDALNHNLLSVTDGAGRLVGAWTYSSTTDPLVVDYDTCASEDLYRSHPLQGNVTLIKMVPAPPVPGSPVVYRCIFNDPLGRVTECDHDAHHRCVAVRQFTGFATPGVPVTDTVNRPDPATRLRAGDLAFYETTFRYNADSCVTRITHPDGTQERFTYGRELRKDCPVRERGNAHLISLRAAGGEDRTVTFDYLPGFGTVEGGDGGLGVWAGEDGDGGCTDDATREINSRNLPSATVLNSYSYTGSGGGGIGSGGGGATEQKGKHKKDCICETCKRVSYIMVHHQAPKSSHMTAPPPPPWGPVPGSFCTAMTTAHGQRFTASYDSHGNCTSERSPVSGAGCDATYNTLGQCTSVTVLNGPGSGFRTEITNDPLTSWPTGCIVDPDVNGTGAGLHITTTCERDNLGRVTRVVDPRGFDWLAQYNALDQVVREQSPPVGSAPTASRIACDFFYDAAGDVARCDFEHRDATGALNAANPAYSAFIVYDSRGHMVRLAFETRPVNVPAVPPLLDPAPPGLQNFAVTDFTHDDAGQCVRVSTPAISRGQSTDAVCDYQYDERGKLYRSISGGLGAVTSVTVQTDYTASGQKLRRMLLPTLPPPPPIAPNPEIVWTYDGFQRVASITDPMGNVTQFEYDGQGFTTVSVFGEVNDGPGSAGNVLLSRVRFRESPTRASLRESPSKIQPRESPSRPRLRESPSKIQLRESPSRPRPETARFRPAFFDVFVADDVWTWERFSPGAPEPHPMETTTMHRSPAGLVQNVTCNGDTLLTCTHDTAGRPATCSDGFVVRGTVRDQLGNVVLDSRTDLVATAGTPQKVYSWASIFDEMGRRLSTTDGGGNVESVQCDSFGRVTRHTDARGTVHRITYDVVAADGGGSDKAYFSRVEVDMEGTGTFLLRSANEGFFDICARRIACVTNSNGHATMFRFDAASRHTQTDFPDGTHEVYGFDNYGRPNSITHKDGVVVLTELDRDGRPDVVTYSGGTPGTVPAPPVDYRYNGLGQCVQCDQGDSHLVFTWDSLGNQLSESHNGHTITRTFNHRGRTSVTYPDHKGWAEVRDFSGMVTSVSALDAAGVPISPPVTQVEYAGHRVARETRANGVVTTHEYRANGDAQLPGGTDDFSFDQCVRTICTNGSGSVIYATRVRRDHNQNVTQTDTFFTGLNQTTGRRHLQTWDRLDRVTSSVISRREVVGGPFVTESAVTYTLDLEGRRLTETDGPMLGLYTQNPLLPPGDHQMSQYSSCPDGPLEWNDHGCLTLMGSSGGTRQFVYDTASRLVAVNDPATGHAIATYAYSADGRRTRSTIAGSDPLLPPVTTFFVYDGGTCVQELGDDGLPNITVGAAHVGPCISTRNGTVIYKHGSDDGSTDFKFPILPAEPNILKEVPVDDDIRMTCGMRAGGGSGGVRTGESTGECFASATGAVTERTDRDHAGTPVFLTSDGAVRPGATGTLSGYDWFASTGKVRGMCANARSDTYLSADRYCPETGFLQAHGTVYSPQLGQPVAKEKKPATTKLSATRGIAVDCRL